MKQMITKEQIAEAAEQYAEQENSAWTNDYNGFEAGANFVMQLLQQTPCTTHVCDCCGSTENHQQRVCHKCRNKW